MSAHDDGQTDEITRGGTLRRLPDPPSPAPARESATRHAEDESATAATGRRHGSSAVEGGTAADRLDDFEPGLVAARPPGSAPAPTTSAADAPSAQQAASSTARGPGEAVQPATGAGPSAYGTERKPTAPPRTADTSAQEPGADEAVHGQTSSAAPGTHLAATEQPTAVLPRIVDAASAGRQADGDAVGHGASPQPHAPSRPAAPHPHTPAPAPAPAARPVAGQPPAPPQPYSGGPYAPYAPPEAHPNAPQPHPYPAGRQAVPYRSVPSRVPVPVVRPELAGTEGRTRHGDTFARRTGRYLKRLVASAEDTAAVTAAARAIQQRLVSGRQIAVTSIRGGSGKSTVAALLALTYARHRTDPVLAVEADPALGTLPRRLSATEVRWSCADLARILDPSMQITDLIGYLLPFPGGGWLLPGSQGTVGAQLDLETYRIVMTSMQRYFAATVVDCQTLPAEVARTALTTTQARVLVTPATVEGVAATRTVLEWLGGLHRSMLPTTVVALTHTTPDSTLDVRRSTELLEQGGAQVVVLPYDRHLAGGGAVRTELLALETQEAAARLGGMVMDRAASR